MANNTHTLADADGDYSDWVEIYNPDTAPVNLAGWYLTDDASSLTKWQFPSQTIPAGGFLVVFASDKDRAVAGAELHTNFKLSASGEFLGLVKPDGVSAAWTYAPAFPPQFSDISYGPTFTGQQSTVTLNATSDVWVRQSMPNTVYDNDGMWVTTDSYDNGQDRLGIVQFNISSVASPINGAWLDLNAKGTGSVTLAPAAWVNSTVQSGPVSNLNYATYASTIHPFQTNFEQLGSGPFPSTSPVAGAYGSTLSATTADRNVLNAIRSGNGIITFIVQAASGGREFSANDTYSGFKPAQLVLDIGPPATLQPTDLRYFTTPSPGGPNYGGATGVVSDTEFSVDRGFYSAPMDTVISTDTLGATIVYTTDGSTPSLTNGTVVPAPDANTPPSATVHIGGTTTLRAAAFKTDSIPTNTDTQTYLFVSDIVTQSPTGQAPPGWPSGSVNGQQFNYGIDPDILNASIVAGDFDGDSLVTTADYDILKAHWRQQVPGYTLGDMDGDGFVDLEDFALFKNAFDGGGGTGFTVAEALLAIPSISLVTDKSNLFDPATGIYVNASQTGIDWERPASIELINPDGSPGFQIDAGVRIRGNFSLTGANPKHAFRLFFRDGDLQYPLFGDEGVDDFSKIDLRTDQNDSWAWTGSSYETFVHDVFARDTQRDMGQPYTRSRYYHLYIDGVYWGIYQTEERPEASYGASYFGGDKADYDVIKSSGGSGGYTTEATDGGLDAWYDLWSQAQAGVADNADYYRLQGLNPDGVTRNPAYPVLLDVDNLIDYMLVNFYIGNEDSPLSLPLGDNKSNNWFAIRDRTGDQGFQFFAHDAEQTLFSKYNVGGLNADRTGPFTGSNQNNFLYSNPQWLHQDLMANAEYRLRFADRVEKSFFNGGALTTEATVARFNALAAELDQAIVAESARWGDASPGFENNPFTRADWQAAVSNIVQNYLPLRGNIVLNQLRADGLFPSTAAPSLSQFGGNVAGGFQLTMTAPQGTIYYTLNGGDPRTGVVYSGPISLNESTNVRARTLQNGVWSAEVSADFLVSVPPVRITEVMYHPVAPAGSLFDKEEFEFIEVQNIGSSPVNLQGMQLADGVTFTFPSYNLAAGAFTVVVEDAIAFQSKYGTSIPIAGQYSGKLSNSGELLTFTDAFGQTITSFTYSDQWYPSTDGLGNSLVIVDPTADPAIWNTAAAWRASTNFDGSPGAADPAAGAGASTVLRVANNDIQPTAVDPGVGPVSAAAIAPNAANYRIAVDGFQNVIGHLFGRPRPSAAGSVAAVGILSGVPSDAATALPHPRLAAVRFADSADGKAAETTKRLSAVDHLHARTMVRDGTGRSDSQSSFRRSDGADDLAHTAALRAIINELGTTAADDALLARRHSR
jgi:CotH kinase protein/Lamin Tail Domain/Chitobiase/beta-hexosaminidase C-terminal domain